MAKMLEFYDLKNKKRYRTSNYRITIRPGKHGNRKFAIAKSPHTGKFNYWRVLPMDFKR